MVYDEERFIDKPPTHTDFPQMQEERDLSIRISEVIRNSRLSLALVERYGQNETLT